MWLAGACAGRCFYERPHGETGESREGEVTKMKLQVAHQVPGRIRMKVPSAKDNPELLEQIRQTFSVIPGIDQVTVNPTTGSVVLHYDTDRHDEFHGHLHHHTGGHYKPPTNEIDSLANKIEQEAEYLAEHPHTAKVVLH